MDTENVDLQRRLEAIDRKLDLVIERQRFVEDLIAEMTPVVREVIKSGSSQLASMEERGWFRFGGELLAALDQVVATTSPEDVRELATHIGPLVSTLRRVSDPEILDLANEATDIVTHADEVRPVGMMGMVRAGTEADVQRGMGVALEVLRHLGRHHASAPRTPAPPAPPAAPPAPTAAPKATPAPAPAVKLSPQPAPSLETVTWEGRAFTAEGFLLDPSTWDEDLARKMADGVGIALTDDHWQVIRWIRADYASTGASPNVRRVASGSGVGTKRMYELFPKTPGKTAAMLSGVPKPVGCV
ncbi:MAG: TusE/DsrC/DsvC family sulfur relay protein [Alphaproteobacteria bacterium]|nr:TusE/DsrC/DsvC family sulfur relay protein [Alphaproteobacteria bacterium]MCB9696708.1 TusE/DsrC/DsvC family sulfur relay protein [Alphaproteobacteria bacterium]